MQTQTVTKPTAQSGLQKYRKAVSATKHKSILDAAEQLFGQQGYHNTGMMEVSREADVSTATLYKHFESKEKLAQLVVERVEKESPKKADRLMANMLTNNQSFVPQRLGALTKAEGVTSVVFNRVKIALGKAL